MIRPSSELLPDALQLERKFLPSRAEMCNFRALVASRLERRIYDPMRPLAFARTTYLDTADLHYYHSRSHGVARRLRLREYAAAAAGEKPCLTGVAFLELKSTSAGLRSKVRLSSSPELTERVLARELDRQAFLACANQSERAAMRRLSRELAGRTLRPRVTTWYRREAFVDADQDIRVTFDTETTFCLPARGGAPGAEVSPGRIIGHGPTYVVEVKYPTAPPSWLAAAMQPLPYPGVISKYDLGMRATMQATSATKLRLSC